MPFISLELDSPIPMNALAGKLRKMGFQQTTINPRPDLGVLQIRVCFALDAIDGETCVTLFGFKDISGSNAKQFLLDLTVTIHKKELLSLPGGSAFFRQFGARELVFSQAQHSFL